MKHYPLEIFWSEEDGGFIAEAIDLPGCCAFGKTEANAASEAQSAIRAWIEAARSDGRDIPEPTPASAAAYSGRFLLRLPRSLHARLARRAKAEGVSLNQYVLTRLAS